MNSTEATQKLTQALMEEQKLPAQFMDIINHVYMPLAHHIMQQQKDKPLFISINGAQGTGKSTLTLFMKYILESELQCQIAMLSLDDFYTTRNERKQLSGKIHPLFITRGVPGTHDLQLLEGSIDCMMSQKACNVPRFNKATDDRCADNEWHYVPASVKIILFEGWCNNSPVQSDQELIEPINELEASEDTQGVWRHYANEQLKLYHQKIFDHTDMTIMLKAPDFEHIYEWRSLQEKKLKKKTESGRQSHVMDKKALERFIQHYERISRHTLSHLPKTADIVLPVNPDHSIKELIISNE